MMTEVKERANRFRTPKTTCEEKLLADEAVPASTKYKNKWVLNIFRELQLQRELKVPVLNPGGLFKDYELQR